MFLHWSPVVQSFLAGLFTFFITVLGASIVLFFNNIKKVILDMMLAISAGIMLAASFFSLLIPAIEGCRDLNITSLVVFIGFILGGFLIYLGNLLLSFLERKSNLSFSKWKRSIMLFSSITLHNIPEGLVIGVSFASCGNSIISAITLTFAIAIQNFPEGSAISLPLLRDGCTRGKAFLFGTLSAIVEPVFALIGAILVLKIRYFLPFILSFTAGAMVYVTSRELIPECQNNEKKDLMVLFILFGFSIMMILELLL